MREWYRSSDPVLIFVREIVETGAATREELAAIDAGRAAVIDRAAKFAVASPYPRPQEALTDVFA